MTRRRVFVDTWAWVAWAVGDDPNHARAMSLREQLVGDGAFLLTSDMVLAEALTRLRYDAGLPVALALLQRVDALTAASALDVVYVTRSLWLGATEWFGRYRDQRFSFVDCLSFAIMADQGLNEALTADRHFATAGFVPLGA